MRTNLIIAFTLLALLGLTVGFNAHKSSREFDTHLHQLGNFLASEDWHQAGKTFARLNDDWRNRRLWLQVTKSTDVISTIDRSLARLGALIRAEAQPDAMAELADLDVLWRDLKE